jgi:hypothetical protein
MMLKSCIACSLVYNNTDVSTGVSFSFSCCLFFLEIARVEIMILDFIFLSISEQEPGTMEPIGQWPLLKMYKLIIALVFVSDVSNSA